MTKITIKEFVEFMAKIGFTPDPSNWPNGYSDTDVLDGVGYMFECDIDKNVWINAGECILIEARYIEDDEIGTLKGSDSGSLKRSFMQELLRITCNFDKGSMYKHYGCTSSDLPNYEDGLGDPDSAIDPLNNNVNDWYTDTLWCYRKQADNLFNWALEIFNRLAKLEVPLGELSDIDDDDEDEEPIGEDQELDEDPILAANGVPKSLADVLRKAVANGTQITGVGPGGSMSDITDLFGTRSVKQVPEAEVLNGYPAQDLGSAETSEEYNAHIQRQAERLNKVMGISVEDSLDQLKSSLMRAAVGVVHQAMQAKDQHPEMKIDEFFSENLYGNKLFPADIKDGLVYSDTKYPVSSSDPVIAQEILKIVHKVLEDSDKNTQTTNSASKPVTEAKKPTIEDFKAVLSKIGFTEGYYVLEAKDIDRKVWLCESLWENGLLIQTKYLVDDEIGEFCADSIDDIIPSFMAELEKQTCGFDKDAYYDRWEATEKYADRYESGPNVRYYNTLENRIEEADAYYAWCCEVYSRLSNLKSGN